MYILKILNKKLNNLIINGRDISRSFMSLDTKHKCCQIIFKLLKDLTNPKRSLTPTDSTSAILYMAAFFSTS